jgi:hypothetical protein
MKANRWSFRVLLTVLALLATVGVSAAGYISGTIVYKDPATGAESPVTLAFLYLHSASQPPQMEKFYSVADQVMGNTTTIGTFNWQVPAGTYYIRITKRMNNTVASWRQYGPPEEGDLTWMQPTPIVVPDSGTVSLGKIYARVYSTSPVTITGKVKTAAGAPLQARYVRAQTQPCLPPVNCVNGVCQQPGNQCGQDKFLALRRTAADGSYTLMLAQGGTYYIYTSTCLRPGHNENDGTRCAYTAAPSPVTVNLGDKVTVDITAE